MVWGVGLKQNGVLAETCVMPEWLKYANQGPREEGSAQRGWFQRSAWTFTADPCVLVHLGG